MKPIDGLDVFAFTDVAHLRAWLAEHHTDHPGIWIRVYKKGSRIPSVQFEEILEEGIAFGWSESKRKSFDVHSYLQQFGPRRSKGTKSERNLRIARRLAEQGRLTEAGYAALGLTQDDLTS